MPSKARSLGYMGTAEMCGTGFTSKITALVAVASAGQVGETYCPNLLVCSGFVANHRAHGRVSSSSFREHTSSQFLLPSESMSDDGGEVVVLRLPPKLHAGVIGNRDDLCWIPRPARCDFDLEVDTRNALDHFDYFAHRKAIAAIQR